MRPTDDQVRHLAEGEPPPRRGDIAEIITELAKEVLEARERGLMGTVDLATQLADNRIPTDMKDGTYAVIPEGALSVCAWTPEEGGKGKTTQVHLVFDLSFIMEGFRVVSRMKSGPGVDTLIRLLAEYRADVWPGYRGVRVG